MLVEKDRIDIAIMEICDMAQNSEANLLEFMCALRAVEASIYAQIAPDFKKLVDAVIGYSQP